MPTIALVGDDRNVLSSVSIALKAEGYHVATYADGASALDGFQTTPPDLAILDIKMPRMDGVETLRQLRAKSNLPVIFLTSTEEVSDEVSAFKMGADDFIRKPFSQRLLASGSRPCCAGRHRRTERFRRESQTSWSAGLCGWTWSAIPAPGKTSV